MDMWSGRVWGVEVRVVVVLLYNSLKIRCLAFFIRGDSILECGDGCVGGGDSRFWR